MMPCRYIFAMRRSVNMSIFEEEMVGQQWLKSYQTKDLFDQSTSSVSDGDVDPLFKRIKSACLPSTLSASLQEH